MSIIALLPTQMSDIVCMVAVGGSVIVTNFVAVLTQPPIVTEYVITEVPALIPVTTPVDEFTVATAGVALVQVPPALVLVQVSDDPTFMGVVPVIVWATGSAAQTAPSTYVTTISL